MIEGLRNKVLEIYTASTQSPLKLALSSETRSIKNKEDSADIFN